MKTVPTSGARAALAAAIAVWTAIALLPASRLAPLPASAEAQKFSAMRAMVHVEAIAQRPHPLGSIDHDRVRDYIRAEIAKQGLTSEVLSGTAEYHWRSQSGSARVENVLARLTGSDNTRAVMLAAHYDSVPEGPGRGLACRRSAR